MEGICWGSKTTQLCGKPWKTQSKGPPGCLFRVTIFFRHHEKSWITIKQPVLYKWKVRGCSFSCQYEHPVVPFPTCYRDISSVVGSSFEPRKSQVVHHIPTNLANKNNTKQLPKTHIFSHLKNGICWNMLEYFFRVSFGGAILAYFQGLSLSFRECSCCPSYIPTPV